MPSRNVRKPYIENGYYHIYNRGVEKRIIFEDQQDYAVFLSYLKDYLLPKDNEFLADIIANPKYSREEKQKAHKLLRLNNFSESISLLAYCLMPNHFHLLIKQTESLAIDKFMNSLCTRYTMYFNFKYKRVGRLYQDVYKAVNVTTDEYLVHLSCYIHRQAIFEQFEQGDPLFTQPSSYLDYLGRKETNWVNKKIILEYFSKSNLLQDYRKSVELFNELLLPPNLIIES